LIGVPTSAGAFAPGQERAPAVLRAAGLTEMLTRAGLRVHDHGDRAIWRWRPDRNARRAQNLGEVVAIVRDTARRVSVAAGDGEITLVLGGDCTTGIGTVAGHVASGARVGLVYFDTHADLNVPESVREGALDWMGLAHMIGEPGAAAELVQVGAHSPLLAVEQVLLFGWGPEQATEFEHEVIERRGFAAIEVGEVAVDPVRAAHRARELLEDRCERLLVHFDVDVIDFTDVPLSENCGRNEGLAYADALCALAALLESPRFAGMTVTELNPDHAEDGANSIERFVTDLARALSGSAAVLRGED
jgi:arginase